MWCNTDIVIKTHIYTCTLADVIGALSCAMVPIEPTRVSQYTYIPAVIMTIYVINHWYSYSIHALQSCRSSIASLNVAATINVRPWTELKNTVNIT